jgi:hypothetical protein
VECRAETVSLADLARPRIEGLTVVSKPPPSGWRDAVALLGTAFGLIGAGAAGVLVSHHPAGILLAPVVAAVGYNKQFWRMAFKRRPRLSSVPRPSAPEGTSVEGIAQPFEAMIGTKQLAIATTFELGDSVIVRAIEAVPFWIALPDRRVLVTGPCWLAGSATQIRGDVTEQLAALAALEVPLTRAQRRKLIVKRVAILEGDRVSVIGHRTEQQIAGAGGYRDSLVETVEGQPGAVVWIERREQ